MKVHMLPSKEDIQIPVRIRFRDLELMHQKCLDRQRTRALHDSALDHDQAQVIEIVGQVQVTTTLRLLAEMVSVSVNDTARKMKISRLVLQHIISILVGVDQQQRLKVDLTTCRTVEMVQVQPAITRHQNVMHLPGQ
jgi:hypothetical protein